MTQVRWKNQFPPTTPRAGYEALRAGAWVAASVAEVRALCGIVLWVA